MSAETLPGRLLLEPLAARASRLEGAVRTHTAAHELALDLRALRVPLPEQDLQVSNWQIRRGEKVALIGRNGVGKSTLTEALLGLRSGAVIEGQMLGHHLRDWHRKPALRTQLGVQLQKVFFPGRPRVSELVALHRKLYPHTSEQVMEALGIPALSRRLYEYLSRGETQRVDLFLALAHQPSLLFLDEPFTGLDPQFTRRLADLLAALTDTTLLMCCHTPDELNLSTHTAWLSRQGVVRHASTQALRRELVGDYRLVAHCSDAASAQLLAARLRLSGGLARLPCVDAEWVTLSSEQPLSEQARQLADLPEVLNVAVGHSQLADLLRHCSRES